ncbi:MAG: MarR family transcriptional regulator [Verrucomicrobia bacterium]|nr:MarR family transcriptional regulator [Verrucomicrobiota bacterium]
MSTKPVSIQTFAADMQRLMPAFLGAMIRREKNAISQGIITLPQFLGLSFLRQNPGSPVKAFAATLGLQLSSASGLIDRMVRNGLIRRERSKTDRRVVLLTLKAKGERMVDEILEQKKQSVAEIFAPLSAEERTTYLELMQKVVGNLDEM